MKSKKCSLQHWNHRLGSAYIVVIGVISVLVIILLAYFRSNISRQFSTRFASNEKRAEALAEAAVDLALRNIKDKMNDANDPNIFPYFRFPAPISTGKLANSTGQNNPLNLTGYLASIPFDLSSSPQPPGFEPIQSLIDELGGPTNVTKLSLECAVIQAEAFASCQGSYEVPGVSVPPTPAQGDPAKFLDKFGDTAMSGGTSQSLMGLFTFSFNLPSPCPIDTPVGAMSPHTIDVDPGFWSFLVSTSAKVELTKLSDAVLQCEIFVKVKEDFPFWATVYTFNPSTDPTKAHIEVDFEEIFRSYVNLGTLPLTLKSILDKGMPQSTTTTVSWNAGTLKSAIDSGYDRFKGLLQLDSFKSAPFGANPPVIEKGGILRIRAEVEFLPNGPGGPKLFRTLLADREFKVSDVQPVAPEYSFFVANSDKILEPGESIPLGGTPGAPIDWILEGGTATMTLHNVPGGEYKNCDGMGSGGDSGPDSKCQVPGMVRINANSKMFVNTFLGTFDEPEITEYNAMAERPGLKPFNLLPVFQWRDKMADDPRGHEIDFPVLCQSDNVSDPTDRPPGVKGLKTLISLVDAICAPCLFFGKGHFEYPLGLRAEAPLDMKYGNVFATVNPKGNADDPKDRTEVWVKYKNLPSPYGLPGQPAYLSSGDWKSTDPRNMPPNLYSTLQYAKKASHFYTDQSEFDADCGKPVADGGRNDGGAYDCTGVTYVAGDLSLGSLSVKGKGILVCSGNITLSGNITRADTDTVFSLIARRGTLLINSGCNKIEAAVFTSGCIQNAAGNALKIDGNLVMNGCNRDMLNSIEVFYNSAACRVTPLSVMRDVGKFEPKRYFVSVGKHWIRFEYEKR